jgi:poly(3-hydroxybutyrate) depolymerase
MRTGFGRAAAILFFLSSLCYSQTDSFMNQGVMRSFIVHKPAGVTSPALVINMHGMGSYASQQMMYSRFNTIADREKFIVVYPNGVDSLWDLSGNRDVIFISALIDTMNARYGIDLNRVHSTGMSMGSFMSHRLACALADRIASIGSVAGLNASNPNNSSRPFPVLHIHGDADAVVVYSRVAATITGWVKRNQCPEIPVITDPYPASNPNSVVKKEYYGPGLDSSEVILLTVKGGGHTWPGFNTNDDINASEEIWNFFKKHPMPVNIGIIDKYNPLHNTVPALWGRSNVDIITIDGRVVAENISANNRSSLLKSLNIAAGIYFIRFRSAGGFVLHKTVLRR